MYIRKNNSYNNTCIECSERNNPKYMYNILFNNTYTQTNNIICPNCLYKLYLNVRDIFIDVNYNDGFDDKVAHNIPPSVYKYILRCQKIPAIKELRKLAGYHDIDENDHNTYYMVGAGPTKYPLAKLSLREAKDKVEYWMELIKVRLDDR